MQAALQPHVDASISKTVNCPAGIPFEDFATIYHDAYAKGLKGCTVYRPNPVTGAVLSPLDGGQPAAEAAGANLPVSISQAPPGSKPPLPHPLQREEVLPGYTYKLRWPESDHAIYVTINDTVDEGRRRPFEIFINSKNLEHYAWTVALTRMISAVFRRGGDVAFVVEELKAVFDPRGGHWLGGRYVPSLLAAIGSIIEKHMIETGFLYAPLALAPVAPPQPLEAAGAPGTNAQTCPRCGMRALAYQEGCHLCRSCGYSTCA
jgi:ribonucleoside-diphosphate reductase alpha chain